MSASSSLVLDTESTDRGASPPRQTSNRGLVEQLYAMHRNALEHYLLRLLQCEATAQDVAQDAFARLLRYQPALEAATARPYLFRVALNIVRSRAREMRMQLEVLSPLEWERDLECGTPGPDRIAAARQVVGILADEIEQLPPRCREVFVMHRLYGLTHDSIAARLAISRSMVEKHVRKATIRCQQRIQKHGLKSV